MSDGADKLKIILPAKPDLAGDRPIAAPDGPLLRIVTEHDAGPVPPDPVPPDPDAPDPDRLEPAETPELKATRRARLLHHSKRAGKRAGRTGLGVVLGLTVAASLLALGAVALTGRTIGLPVWAVSEVEQRVNAILGDKVPDLSFSLGGVELLLDEDWTPRLRLEDLRLLHNGQRSLLVLPDLRLSFDAGALLNDRALRPSSLRLIGGELRLRRLQDGRLDLDLGNNRSTPPINGLADAFTLLDNVLDQPILSHLRLVETEAASFTLSDARLGRVWTVGDGRLRLENRDDALAAELGMTLLGGGQAPAQALLTMVRPKGQSLVRLSATVTDVAAVDMAAQSPMLSGLAPLDAPISGSIHAEVNDSGLQQFDAALSMGAGALRPDPAARPIGFDRAQLGLRYQPDTGRLQLTTLQIDSPSLRFRAEGHAFPIDGEGAILTGTLGSRLPEGFIGQFHVSDTKIDPEGLFESPLVFSDGTIDLRLKLDPFRLEIGQMSLIEQSGSRLQLTAHAQAVSDIPTERSAAVQGGWIAGVDLSLDRIAHDRLLQLWPKSAVPKTRDWVGENVAEGELTNVRAALRLSPDHEPRFSLNYNFIDGEARFIRTLPPVTRGHGRQTIEGKTYTLALDGGEILSPDGGKVDVAGSVFKVDDITARPAMADITLNSRSSVTSALSVLDMPPFNFMAKAGRSPDLAEGQAQVVTQLRLPLQRKVTLADVDYTVEGVLSDLTSSKVVPNKVVTADRMTLSADRTGLTIAGPGKIGKLPFDVSFRQGFAPEDKGKSSVKGTAELSPLTVEEFALALPQGLVAGKGSAEIDIAMAQGQPAQLTLNSNLRGVSMAIPQVGWSKAANDTGRLAVNATLAQPITVDSLQISGAGLDAEGQVSIAAGGGLDRVRFGQVKLGRWFEGPVDLVGRGKGAAPDVVVSGGRLDLRSLPDLGRAASGAAAQAGGKVTVELDRLQVNDAISLRSVVANLTLSGGLRGDFQGLVNGQAAVTGSISPSRYGQAVQLHSRQAGDLLRAAEIFKTARGGNLDMILIPRPQKGVYDGQATLRDFRVKDTGVLAELLSAVSVVGLLEQLWGEGIAFQSGEAKFVLQPQAVEITEASAIGASLGVTLSGLYATKTKQLALRGMISPVYLLNGIGAALTRRGEGLFGFDYEISGRSDAPRVSVNPLSILTPGMFRDLFRRPPPVLRQAPK